MEFKIYVANLAKYNSGILKGEWLELPMEAEELQASLKDILGNDEEVAIHDYENDLGYEIHEYDNINSLNELAERLDSLETYEITAVKAYMECMSNNLEEALDCIEAGDYSSYPDCDDEESIGQYVVEEGLMGDIPDNLKFYINYEAIGRDIVIETTGCFMDGDYIYFT